MFYLLTYLLTRECGEAAVIYETELVLVLQ